jgi:hypothetical protein
MSKVFVLALPGAGKTSSIRNLPFERTGLINPDKKELPIQGWRKKYVTRWGNKDGFPFPDLLKSNYVETSKFSSVMDTLAIWDERPDLDYIALDTITHLITHDYVKNTIGKDFKAYQRMGGSFYDLVDFIRQMKKNVVVYGHIEKAFNDVGDKSIQMKAPGKMIAEFEPPSFFTTVLLGEILRKDGVNQHVFRTQSIDNDIFKSPAYFIGEQAKTALEFYEPNDIKLIFDKLKKFEDTLELSTDPIAGKTS